MQSDTALTWKNASNLFSKKLKNSTEMSNYDFVYNQSITISQLMSYSQNEHCYHSLKNLKMSTLKLRYEVIDRVTCIDLRKCLNEWNFRKRIANYVNENLGKKATWQIAWEDIIWASAWDFQHFGMCDQQSLRSACAYAQSDQSLC